MRKSLLIACALCAFSVSGNAQSIQHLADESFQFQVRPEYRIARLPSVLESVRDSHVDLINLQSQEQPPAVVSTPEAVDAEAITSASPETAPRVNPLRPQVAPAPVEQSMATVAANPSVPYTAGTTSGRTPVAHDESTRLQRLVSTLNGGLETSLPEFPAAPPFTSNYSSLTPSTIKPASPIGSLHIKATGDGVSQAPVTPPTVAAPANVEAAPPSDGSVLGMIGNRSLFQGKTPHRIGLNRLLATALKYERNVRSSGYQVVTKSQLPSESDFWHAVTQAKPHVDQNIYRIHTNYLNGSPSNSVPSSEVFQILRTDLHTSDSQLVAAVVRKLDAITASYWQLVTERGKLIAASDLASFCESILVSLRGSSDTRQDNLYTQARASYDRSLARQNKAYSKTVAAQQRLAELVGDPTLVANIEIIPVDLPKSVTLDPLPRQLAIANANRKAALVGSYGVSLDVQVAHRQLSNALQQVNRSLQSVVEGTQAVAQLNASLGEVEAANAMTLALYNQERLCESQTSFLDALADQQLAFMEMKRANGTLIRIEQAHSAKVATIDLSEQPTTSIALPQSNSPTHRGPSQLTPAVVQPPVANNTQLPQFGSHLPTPMTDSSSPLARPSKWNQQPTGQYGYGVAPNATTVQNPFTQQGQQKPILKKKVTRSPVNRTTTPRRTGPNGMRSSSNKNRSTTRSWLARLTGSKG